MEAIRYDEEAHGADTRIWCTDRGMSIFPEAWLPKTGAIVPGVLAAWLYKTDSGCCWMENVISNPLTTQAQRVEAITLVAEVLEAEARACGFRYMLGFSAIPTVIEAARAFGMKPTKTAYFTLTKELKP